MRMEMELGIDMGTATPEEMLETAAMALDHARMLVMAADLWTQEQAAKGERSWAGVGRGSELGDLANRLAKGEDAYLAHQAVTALER